MMAGAWEKTKLALLGVAAGLVYGTVKAAGFQSIDGHAEHAGRCQQRPARHRSAPGS